MIRKFAAMLALFLAVGAVRAEAKSKHALARVAKVAVSPVIHPKRTFKQTIGAVVFAVEAGNDVVLIGLTALDKGASVELKHNPFHYAAVVDSKIDAGLEYAQGFFFAGKP